MNQQITIIGRIEGLTKIKEAILKNEYDRFNNICQQVQECRNNDIDPIWKWFKDKNTYSRHCSIAIHIIKEPFIKLKKQPFYLSSDVSRLEKGRLTSPNEDLAKCQVQGHL